MRGRPFRNIKNPVDEEEVAAVVLLDAQVRFAPLRGNVSERTRPSGLQGNAG